MDGGDPWQKLNVSIEFNWQNLCLLKKNSPLLRRQPCFNSSRMRVKLVKEEDALRQNQIQILFLWHDEPARWPTQGSSKRTVVHAQVPGVKTAHQLRVSVRTYRKSQAPYTFEPFFHRNIQIRSRSNLSRILLLRFYRTFFSFSFKQNLSFYSVFRIVTRKANSTSRLYPWLIRLPGSSAGRVSWQVKQFYSCMP